MTSLLAPMADRKRWDVVFNGLLAMVERAEENDKFSRFISGEMQGEEREAYAAKRLNDYAELAHEYDSGRGYERED